MARAADMSRSRYRLVLKVSSGLAAVAIGVFGLGAAADGAIPGEFLYSIDRAYESVGSFLGIDGGSGEERVLEAIALIDRGDEADAIATLSEALVAIEQETGVAGISRTLTTISQPEFALPPELNRDETAPVEVAEAPLADTVAAAAPAGESPLKLAAEMLLRSLQGDAVASADELTAAVDEVEAAALAIEIPVEEPAAETTTTTTEVATDDSSTTTSLPDGDSTTTTTLVLDDSTTTTTTEPDDGGPIILPPQP
jgi:hypothetical protein